MISSALIALYRSSLSPERMLTENTYCTPCNVWKPLCILYVEAKGEITIAYIGYFADGL